MVIQPFLTMTKSFRLVCCWMPAAVWGSTGCNSWVCYLIWLEWSSDSAVSREQCNQPGSGLAFHHCCTVVETERGSERDNKDRPWVGADKKRKILMLQYGRHLIMTDTALKGTVHRFLFIYFHFSNGLLIPNLYDWLSSIKQIRRYKESRKSQIWTTSSKSKKGSILIPKNISNKEMSVKKRKEWQQNFPWINWWVTACCCSQSIYISSSNMWACTVCVFGVRWSTKLATRLPAVWPGHTRQMVSETVGKGMFVYLCVHTICRIPLIHCAWIVCICL